MKYLLFVLGLLILVPAHAADPSTLVINQPSFGYGHTGGKNYGEDGVVVGYGF